MWPGSGHSLKTEERENLQVVISDGLCGEVGEA